MNTLYFLTTILSRSGIFRMASLPRNRLLAPYQFFQARHLSTSRSQLEPIPRVNRVLPQIVPSIGPKSSEGHSRNVMTGMSMMLFLSFVYMFYNDLVKRPVEGKSILSAGEDNAVVIHANQLHQTDVSYVGRSSGRQVYLENRQGEKEYFFYKEAFYREKLINELLYGALAKALFPEEYPRIFLVESPLSARRHISRYSMISEILGHHAVNANLEEWTQSYAVGQKEGCFTNLGPALAFDMLMGKTDIKWANFAKSDSGIIYSIDHENAGGNQSHFIENGFDAVQYIGEFAKATPLQLGHQYVGYDESMLIGEEDFHMPLKDDKTIKNMMRPLFAQAIQQDKENGKILAFYERFAALTLDEITAIAASYGDFITREEQQSFIQDIQKRQALTRCFLAEKTNQCSNDVLRIGRK